MVLASVRSLWVSVRAVAFDRDRIMDYFGDWAASMRLVWGNVSPLRTQPWAQIEINAKDAARPMQVEGIVTRTALWGRRFPEFEMVVPIEKVTKDGVELTLPFLYARTRNLTDIREVTSVWGVECVTEDGVGQVFQIPDSFVQSLVEKEEALAIQRTPKLNDFVRVLWGPERMLCGKVRKIKRSLAEVLVELRSRTLVLTLPLTALWTLNTEIDEYFYLGD